MISSSLWRSRKFRKLQSDAARLAYFYLHTHEGGNSLGAFHMSHEQAAIGMKRDAGELLSAYRELQSVGLIRYDEEEELVYIVGFVLHSAPQSYKHLSGLDRIFKALPEGALKADIASEIATALEDKASEWSDDVTSKDVFVSKAKFLRATYGRDTPIYTPIVEDVADTPMHTPTDTQDKTETIKIPERDGYNGGGGSDEPTERELLLVAMGHDASGVTATGRMVGNQGDMMVFNQWQSDLGLSWDEIVGVIQEVRSGPSYPAQSPFSFKFFNSPMQRLAGQKAAAPLKPDEGNHHDRPNQRPQGDRGIASRVHKLRGASLVPDSPAPDE